VSTRTETITLEDGTVVTFMDNGEVFSCDFFPGITLARFVEQDEWNSWDFLKKTEILLLCATIVGESKCLI
jgi:hypothetical protein